MSTGGEIDGNNGVLLPELESIKALEFPLHEVSVNKRPDLLAELLRQSCNVNLANFDLVTPLHEACLHGDVRCVSLLLAAGATVDARNIDGCTPLCEACAGGHVLCAKLLIENGAKVNTDLFHFTTPLHEAAIKGSPDTVSVLIEAGALLEVSDLNFGTSLQAAVYRGHIECARRLLQAGANVSAPRNHHSTLHQAALDNNLELARLLVAHGADPTLEDLHGRRPREMCDRGTDVWEYLIHAERNPRRLLHLTRLTIRRTISPKHLKQLADLRLPSLLKQYLLHEI